MPPVDPNGKDGRDAGRRNGGAAHASAAEPAGDPRGPALRLARFCLTAMLIYAALAAPWPALGRAYRALHNAAANGVFGNWSQSARVEFAPLDDERRTKEKDTVVTIQVRDVATKGNVEISSMRNGYLPTAELAALVLATPIAFRRRLWALLWGTILVNGFVGVRLAAMLIYYFCYPWEVRLYEPGPLLAKVIVEAHELLFRAPTCTFLVPAVIWIAVVFRRPNLTNAA